MKKPLSFRLRLVGIFALCWLGVCGVLIGLTAVLAPRNLGSLLDPKARALHILVVAAGVGSAWWVLRLAMGRSRAICRQAAEISVANLSQRLPLTGSKDELDDLIAVCNEFLARLEKSYKQSSLVLANIAHELRTPLSALRAETELALRWAKSREEFHRVLASNIEELDRLTRMLSNLILFERSDRAGLGSRKLENITEMVRVAVEAVSALAAKRMIDVRMPLAEDIFSEVDPEQMWRLLLALLDNAIKFSHDYGQVEVTVQPNGQWALISVADSGLGVDPVDLPHIFEPFYRSSNPTNKRIHGAGLGLSFVRQIAEAHGARLEVKSQPGSGACFEVWLKRAPARSFAARQRIA